MTTVYAVRHKPSGLFIPRLETGKRRGGSHLEPSDAREPRIFHNYRAAQSFLGNWLQGKFKYSTPEYGYSASFEPPEPELQVIKQENRKKEDMEIVKFYLIEAELCK